MEDYQPKRDQYLSEPEAYLIEKASEITWFKEWQQLHNYETDPHDMRWFIGGRISLTYEMLDKQILEGRGDEPAIIYDHSSDNDTSIAYTYRQLLDKVSKMAGFMAGCGLTRGDIVSIYLPDIAEIVIAMLATIRLGAAYNVMTTIHPEQAMSERIDNMKPKIIITTNCECLPDNTKFNSKEYLDGVLKQSKHKIDKCIVVQRCCQEPVKLCDGRDIDWEQAIAKGSPHEHVPVEINEPTFIIYTSGTTGKPKGVIISARYILFNLILAEDLFVGVRPKDGEHAVSYSTSHYCWLGGQMGRFLAPLYRRMAILISELPGIDGNIGDFYGMLAKHKVNRVFLSTTMIRTVIAKDPEGEIVASYQPDFKFRAMTMGGVPGDKSTFSWIRKHLKVPFFQVYGLTECGVISSTDLSNGQKYSDMPEMSSGKASPGVNLKVLRQDGTEAGVNEIGRLAIRMPTPVATSGFYNDKDNRKFIDDYLSSFPGYIDLHDEGYFDSNEYVYVLNRSDSVFKIAGNRISCDGIEEVFMTHPRMAECIVVTRLTEYSNKQIPFGFFVLKSGAEKYNDEDVPHELQRLVINQLGDWVILERIVQVPAIPKTITGKLDRGTVIAIVRQQQQQKILDTKDPVLKQFRDIVTGMNDSPQL